MNKMMNKDTARRAMVGTESRERMIFAAKATGQDLLLRLGTEPGGLPADRLEEALDTYGKNIVTTGKRLPLFRRIAAALINPFTGILLLLAAVSAVTDIALKPAGEKNPTTVIIIAAMVLISGVLRFTQETRSGAAAERLLGLIRTTTCVERPETGKMELPLEEVAVGDFVYLSAGDMIPADVRILYAKDLFVSQSALTGESEPVEKLSIPGPEGAGVTDYSNLAFMGSNVVSGSAKAVVVATGNDTLLGGMAKVLAVKPQKTSFEKGINSVSFVLIRFMMVMVPIVFVVNGLTKGNWMSAALFAISVAVGLTPEMLPMLVTTCLAKGAVAMSHKKVIIKDLNAIQNLGAMDILCTDKTGTLTRDQVVLERHLDVMGNEDPRVLRHAFLNSFYQTGLKNLIDLAIIRRQQELSPTTPQLAELENRYRKLDEIPFDFERRRMSVVVADQSGKTQMITKGAVEEMLHVSSYVEYDGKVEPLTDTLCKKILNRAEALNEEGMRVIAVAQKTNPAPAGQFSVADERDMVLIGYLAFLDPPKETARDAVRVLKGYGVKVKVLTGDNERVTGCICRKVGIPVQQLLLGPELEQMDDETLAKRVEETTVFAKLSPAQKARVVEMLRQNGHVVGYMGDGINDAAAIKASDAGISVDTAVDIAKESAGVVLLEKDLMVLERGVLEGRKIYVNMMKYIKMTVSSNFGNMLSVLAASAFLPFLPMASIQLILLNLVYDISCTAIPWDHVDEAFLLYPRRWDAPSISKFMLFLGPVSSVFDLVTYAFLYFLLCPAVCGAHFHQMADPAMQARFIALFQAGWFVESMWSQSLVIHMIRTPKIPFLQSRASMPVLLFTFSGATLLTILPFTPLGTAVGLSALPAVYFGFLALVIVCYMLAATAAKRLYIRQFGTLL